MLKQLHDKQSGVWTAKWNSTYAVTVRRGHKPKVLTTNKLVHTGITINYYCSWFLPPQTTFNMIKTIKKILKKIELGCIFSISQNTIDLNLCHLIKLFKMFFKPFFSLGCIFNCFEARILLYFTANFAPLSLAVKLLFIK